MPTSSKADQIAHLRQMKYSDGSNAIVATPVYEPYRAVEDSDLDLSDVPAPPLRQQSAYQHEPRSQPKQQRQKPRSDKRTPRNAIDSPDRQDFLIRAIAREVVAALKDLAAAQDRSVNWLAIHLLTEYVEAHS